MKAILNSYPPNTPTGLGTLCRSLLKVLPFEGLLWHPHRLAPTYERRAGEYAGVNCASDGCWTSPVLEAVRSCFPGTWIVAIERPLPGDLFARAKAAGMRTALIVMHEWFNRDCSWIDFTDLFICPNDIAFKKVQYSLDGRPRTLIGDVNSVKCRLPLDLDSLPFRERTKVDRFVFSNGWGGVHDRKGWPEMREAIRLLPPDIQYRVKVCSQRKLLGNDVSVPTTADIYADADCAVVPSRFEGLGLAILEPMAMGLPVLASCADPMKEYLDAAYGDLAPFCYLTMERKEDVSIWGYPVTSSHCLPAGIARHMQEVAAHWHGMVGNREPGWMIAELSRQGRRWIEEQWGASAAKQLEELLS